MINRVGLAHLTRLPTCVMFFDCEIRLHQLGFNFI